MDINEARKNLEASLGDPALMKEYIGILERYFSFKSPISRRECYSQASKLLTTQEQIRCHNEFFLALFSEPSRNRGKTSRAIGEKRQFESAHFNEYVPPVSPSNLPPEEYKMRSAASELFIPDANFMAMKIALVAWDCKMEGAGEKVTELMMHACQVFDRNIITAMISKLKMYKVRDGKFQYGFNTPNPNPFLFNYRNVVDETEANQTEVVDDDDTLVPKVKPSLEKAEQENAFAFACTKKKKTNNALTMKLLYYTLKDNPKLLGSHEAQNVSLLKLALILDL